MRKGLVTLFGVVALSMLSGSPASEKVEEVERPITYRDYFDTFNAHYEGGITSAVGDFNEDGHQDLVVGTIRSSGKAELRYYEGDGKGNFRLKQFPN